MRHARPGFEQKLLLVRHAQTRSNTTGVYAGRSAEALSAVGVRQAAELAARLETEGIARVIASPVVRAEETGRIVADRLRVPLELDENLAEMLLGPWTGLTESEVAERYPAEFVLWHTRSSQVRLPGRETLVEVQERALRALERACDGATPALIVTHVALIRTALLAVQGRSLDEYKRIEVPNCEPFEVRVSDVRAALGWRGGPRAREA